MISNSPTTYVDYLDGIKPYIARQVDSSFFVNLQAIYEEAENFQGKADSFFILQKEKKKPSGGRSCNPVANSPQKTTGDHLGLGLRREG